MVSGMVFGLARGIAPSITRREDLFPLWGPNQLAVSEEPVAGDHRLPVGVCSSQQENTIAERASWDVDESVLRRCGHNRSRQALRPQG
jgi:hypothetical protein